MQDESPFFSVIVPVYNTEAQTLRRCLESIRQQHADFEAIIIDDGSTNGNALICDEYGTDAMLASPQHVITACPKRTALGSTSLIAMITCPRPRSAICMTICKLWKSQTMQTLLLSICRVFSQTAYPKN